VMFHADRRTGGAVLFHADRRTDRGSRAVPCGQTDRGSRAVPCGQTDGRTGMTKLIVAFLNSANAPKDGKHLHLV